MTAEKVIDNPLGKAPVGKLMRQFAVPSIISMVVSSIYNMVDQLFIGQAVGTYGNAATNIAFPLMMCCVGIALLLGIGASAAFNLKMGAGHIDKAPYYVGSAVTVMVLSGIVVMLIAEIWLTQLLTAFGSPAEVLPYAEQYVRIIAIGFPLQILMSAGGHLIRADGSPRMTMIVFMSGAIINIFLDALFVMGFGWKMEGAAWATVIGQGFSAVLVIIYLFRFKTVKLKLKHFIPRWRELLFLMSLGLSNGITQVSVMIFQIVLNNVLRTYGAMSPYGEAIPIAVAGIGSKVNQLSFSIIIGLAQGSQPVESFNYGARKYARVREAYREAFKAGLIVSLISFLIFQIFPAQIVSLFGDSSELTLEFGARYFRVYLFFTWINFMQPITATLLSSIGKPVRASFLSLTRYILFLLPLVLILPNFFRLDGIFFAALAADAAAATVAIVMTIQEMRDMRRLEREMGGMSRPEREMAALPEGHSGPDHPSFRSEGKEYEKE